MELPNQISLSYKPRSPPPIATCWFLINVFTADFLPEILSSDYQQLHIDGADGLGWTDYIFNSTSPVKNSLYCLSLCFMDPAQICNMFVFEALGLSENSQGVCHLGNSNTTGEISTTMANLVEPQGPWTVNIRHGNRQSYPFIRDSFLQQYQFTAREESLKGRHFKHWYYVLCL